MNKPASILFTVPNFVTAGSGSAMLNVVRSLDPQKYLPAICVLKKGGRLYDEAENAGIKIFEATFMIPARPYTSFLLRAFQASRVFRPYQFKIWHSFHYLDDYTEPVIAKFSGARFIYTKKNMSWGPRSWKLKTFLSSGIAMQNTAMEKLFFQGVRKPLAVIPPGVRSEIYKPLPRNEELKKSLGLKPGDILIGHSAHFVPVKNHAHLVRVAALMKSQVHLVFAGRMSGDAYSESVKRMAEDLKIENRVHFYGEVKEMSEFLRGLDIFAFCSHQEACPVAVLEAMACGLPCVVTDISGIRDMHTHRLTGLVVPPNDVRAFANALNSLVEDPGFRASLGEGARRRIEEFFSLSRETQEYEKLYQAVLE